MRELHFNFKDLFRAARIGFSLQRIWVNGIGLLSGLLFYWIISYISLMVGGYNFATIWQNFGLLPCAFAMPVPWFAMIIYLVGVILFIAIILLTNTAVSRLVYMVLRNEIFYTWTQAYKFALKKWVSVTGAMLTFILMIAFFVAGALIMGLIGRIPFIGELGTSLLTIPYILAALLLFFIAIVFGIGLLFVPSIVATSDEDALGGVFQSFSITFNQPWRIIVYGIIVGLLEIVGIVVFAAALKFSYHIFIGLFSIGMGEKLVEIQGYLLYIIDNALPTLYEWLHVIMGDLNSLIYLTSQHPVAPSLPGTYVVSAYIFAVFAILIGGAVLAYGEAIGNAGATIIYVILYKIHENENLLEREDEELKEEEEELEEFDQKTEETEETTSDTEKDKDSSPDKESPEEGEDEKE